MQPRATRKFYAVLPVLWAIVMLVLTLTPAQEMPRTPEWKFLSFDTAAHAGVFAVLAVLSWVALRQQRRWSALAQRAGLVVLLGCVLFGGLIEILQYVMHVGRHAEWSDLVGDSAGAALALLLVSGSWRWWQSRRLATTTLLVLLLLGSSLFFAYPSRAQQPDMGRARRTIAVLASPNLHGRGYVRGGEHRAAAYLRSRLRQLGLQPLAPNYTQPFMLDVNTFPGKLKVEISDKPLVQPGQPAWQPGRDYIAAPNSAGTRAAFAKPLRLDSLIFSVADTTKAWLRREVKFHTLLLTDKQQARLSTLPLALQQHLDSAFARITLVSKLTASLAATQAAQPRVEVLADRWRDGRLIHLRIDAELKHNYQTQNLAAIVRGRTQPDSFLVITAHYDHLGMMGKKAYFPGANDNASGVALLLELAAHYARPENKPTCSVVFLLFGAEEAGLLGSRYFVAHPLLPLPRIKFLVNLDLLGTGEAGATVVNGKVFEPAYQRLAALNDTHHYLPHLTARGRAANSDHFPFSEAGVPAFFLYTRGGSQAYHDVNDRPAALSLAGFAGAFGLVRDFLDGLGARP
ncbi:MAG: VanZ family protein [Janthinobacterium lividum]